MKTSSQKYKRRHWYKFINWLSVTWIALVVFALIAFFYTVFSNTNKHEEKNENAVDSVVDFVPAIETKDDTAKFDTAIDNTRIVIKTNRPIKIKIQ